MSVSTPIKTGSRRSAATRFAPRAPYWLLSVVLHVILLVVLILALPVRTIVFRRDAPAQPPVVTRGAELQQIIEAIRDRTLDRLRGRVALLEQGRIRMAENFRILNEHFMPFAEQQRATARARLDDCVRQVQRMQAQLAGTLAQAQHTNSTTVTPGSTQIAMARTLTAQDEIRRGMLLLGVSNAAVMAHQHAAQELQILANQHLRFYDQTALAVDRAALALAEVQTQICTLAAHILELTNNAARALSAIATAEKTRAAADTRLHEWDQEYHAAQSEERRLDMLRQAHERQSKDILRADTYRQLPAPEQACIRQSNETVLVQIRQTLAAQTTRVHALKNAERDLRSQVDEAARACAAAADTQARTAKELAATIEHLDDARRRETELQARWQEALHACRKNLAFAQSAQSNAAATQTLAIARLKQALLDAVTDAPLATNTGAALP
jgi:hypothetical protein